MSKQENFNDILRSKFIERDIPANDEDWRKMRKTIDDSRRRKKRFVWISLSCILGLMLGFGIYEYTTIKNTLETNVAVNSKTIAVAPNKASDIKNVNSNTSKVATPLAKEEKGNVAETNSNKANSIISNEPAKAITKPIVASASNENRTESSKHSSPLTKAVKTTIVQSNATTESAMNSSVSSKTKIADKENKPLPAENNSTAQEKEISSNVPSTSLPGAGSYASNKKPDSTLNNKAVTNAVTSTSNATVSIANEVNKKTDSISKNNVAAETTKNNVTPAKSDSTNKKVDSIPPPLAVSVLESPLPPIEGTTPKKNSFSIEAGGGYSLGWSYGDTVQGRGINPTIGIGYTHTLNPKFALKTGLQVSALGNMGSSPFIIKHVTYDFNYSSNDTSLKTNWLFYLTVPLQIEYKLDEKDAIGTGGTVSYLINGYGDVSISSVSGDVSKTTNTYSQFMYVKGFNQWNASVFLLYKRTLFGKLSAYIIPYFGLMDIKNNSFFSQNKFERDSGLKLLLSYTIL